MKTLILLLITTLNVLENDISKINILTKSAEKAFKRMDYKLAIQDYEILIDSFNVSNEKIHLNLAHSYLLNNDTLKAIENYNMASITNDKIIKSISYQQLGNINESKNKLKEASEFYKKSILSNNSNYDSKYNYELVTKKLEEQDKNQEDKKEQDKNQEDKKEQDKKEQDKKEQEKSIEEKLKEVNMSKKKAEMILNALNNIEFQYIQQLKRKATKKVDKSKPDW